jgi:drug/metabolite transporter (DMT)-like permease
MTPVKIVGILLIAAGVLALVYGSFSYTKETHKAELGPLKIQVAEKETVNVPQWAGIAAVVAGIVLLVIPRK